MSESFPSIPRPGTSIVHTCTFHEESPAVLKNLSKDSIRAALTVQVSTEFRPSAASLILPFSSSGSSSISIRTNYSSYYWSCGAALAVEVRKLLF